VTVGEEIGPRSGGGKRSTSSKMRSVATVIVRIVETVRIHAPIEQGNCTVATIGVDHGPGHERTIESLGDVDVTASADAAGAEAEAIALGVVTDSGTCVIYMVRTV
jgi:hypothetical protein